jgi:hypothetical protein
MKWSTAGGIAPAQPALEKHMKVALFLSVAVAVVGVAPVASALTIINRDADERQVTIVEANDEQIFILDPEQSLHEVCMSGCAIAIGEEDAVEVDGDGVVAIVDGTLVSEQ